MSEPVHDLERLISRHLDDECTPSQRRELNARVRREPQAAALFEEHRALDREIKHALRRALGHPPSRHRPLPMWERAARLFAVAAAACLVAAFWFTPAQDTPSNSCAATGGRSWFDAPPCPGDTLIDTPRRFNRPQIRVGRPDTSWIVIPSERPGEFLAIEVNRVLTRAVHIQQDF